MYESDEALAIRRGLLEAEIRQYKGLIESEFYQFFLEHLKARLLTHRSQLMSMDIGSQEQVMALVRLRGQAAELEAVMVLPALILENLQADVTNIYSEQATRSQGEKD